MDAKQSVTLTQQIEVLQVQLATVEQRALEGEAAFNALVDAQELSPKDLKRVKDDRDIIALERQVLTAKLTNLQRRLEEETEAERRARSQELTLTASEMREDGERDLQAFWSHVSAIGEIISRCRTRSFAFNDVRAELRYLYTLHNEPCPDIDAVPCPLPRDLTALTRAMLPLGVVPSSRWDTLRGELIEQQRQEAIRQQDQERRNASTSGFGFISREQIVTYDPQHDQTRRPTIGREPSSEERLLARVS